jgi:spermidine/putrescine transport system permease protein
MRPARSLLGAYSALYLVFLYVPVLMLPLFSFNGATYAAFPIQHLTWRWYAQLWDDAGLKRALLASLSVAVPAALIATVSGTLAAYALVRSGGRAAGLVASLSVAPLLIPGVILGIALLVGARVVGLEPSLPVVALGQAVLSLPLSLIIMRGHFRASSRSIEEAALDLGATRTGMFLRVVLPLAWPSLLSCLILSFTNSMDEFVVSFFLVGTRQTLPLFIWDHLRFPTQLPHMMALGSLLLLGSLVLALLGDRLVVKSMRNG